MKQVKWAIQTPSVLFTRTGLQENGLDLLGYCFASTKEKAVSAFREHHKIPAEIKLEAQKA